MRYLPSICRPFLQQAGRWCTGSEYELADFASACIKDCFVNLDRQYNEDNGIHTQARRTPFIMWQPYKPYLAQNIAEFVVSLKEDYRLSQKINVFNAKHPEDHVVAGSGEYIHCSDIEQKSVKLDKYDSLINNVLVTRVWHNSNDINVLNEHGNFLYSYMLAINHPHDFHI